jgi:hypothetical protein
MEGAMLKANLWKSVPKVELDQRARDGRLQLERIERLLVIPRAAVMRSRLRRLLFLLSVRLYGGELSRLPTRRELAGTALGIIFATMMLTTLSLLFLLQ